MNRLMEAKQKIAERVDPAKGMGVSGGIEAFKEERGKKKAV